MFATVDNEAPGRFVQERAPGFVGVLGDEELAFSHYDGNEMLRSMGNVLALSKVALLFVDFERPERVRIHGADESLARRGVRRAGRKTMAIVGLRRHEFRAAEFGGSA